MELGHGMQKPGEQAWPPTGGSLTIHPPRSKISSASLRLAAGRTRSKPWSETAIPVPSAATQPSWALESQPNAEPPTTAVRASDAVFPAFGAARSPKWS